MMSMRKTSIASSVCVVLLFVAVSGNALAQTETVDMESPDDELMLNLSYIVFDVSPQDYRIPAISQNLLSKELEVGQENVSTRSYLYFQNDDGMLWFYPLSGAFRWQSSTMEEWKKCPVPETISAVNGELLDMRIERATDFLQTSGLVPLVEFEDLVFQSQQGIVRTSYSLATKESTSRTRAVILSFGRAYMGQRFAGRGSIARVYFGCNHEVVGADVIWRPIVGIEDMPPEKWEMLQAKWEWELTMKANADKEVVDVTWPDTEVRWRTYGAAVEQSRAIPCAYIPVTVLEYSDSGTDQPIVETETDEDVVVVLGDDSIVDEGLVFLSEIPADPVVEEEPLVSNVPGPDADPTTDF